MEAHAKNLWMYTRTQTASHWIYFPMYTAVDLQHGPRGEGATDADSMCCSAGRAGGVASPSLTAQESEHLPIVLLFVL